MKPKPRHKAVAKELKRQAMAQEYIPIADTLVNVGKFRQSVGKHSSKAIMETEAMQQALKDEGLSITDTDNVVKSIVNSKVISEMISPDNILRGADMIYKRLSAYAPDRHINLNVNSPYKGLSDEELAEIAYKA